MSEIVDYARKIETLESQTQKLELVIRSFGDTKDPNAFNNLKSIVFEKNEFGSQIAVAVPAEFSDAFFSAVLPQLRKQLHTMRVETITLKQQLAALIDKDLKL